MSTAEKRRLAGDLKERSQKVVDELYKAHGLSRALDFMTEATSPLSMESPLAISTFVNSVEEVNNALYGAVLAALEHAERLAQDLPKGGAK